MANIEPKSDNKLKVYAPLLITLGVAAYMGLKPLFLEKTFDATDIAQLLLAVMTAGTVYMARNVDIPNSRKIKTVFTIGGTILGALSVMLIGGLDSDEWFDLGVLFLAAIGVTGLPGPAPILVQPSPPNTLDSEGDPQVAA